MHRDLSALLPIVELESILSGVLFRRHLYLFLVISCLIPAFRLLWFYVIESVPDGVAKTFLAERFHAP